MGLAGEVSTDVGDGMVVSTIIGVRLSCWTRESLCQMDATETTPSPPRRRRLITWLRRAGVVMLVALFALACAFGFGITPDDLDRIVAFDRAVARWQVNPDFRDVTFEYVDLGSSAMQTRLCGIRAKSAIMAFRRIPGLPADIAVNPTSQSHYDDFASGPWAAYFHLCGEQDLPTGIAMIEKLGPVPSDEQIRQMLHGFHLPVPTATDEGAVTSVRRLLADVKPDQPFKVRERLFGREKLHEGDGYSMMQQTALLRTLDRELHEHNFEAWRAKQVNDFLSGIWAQGYGQMYAEAVHVVLIARQIGRILSTCMLLGLIGCMIWTRSVKQRSPLR